MMALKLSDAASIFGKVAAKSKASAKGRTSGCDTVSNSQIESKRQASRRTAKLASAPDHVKRKWAEICSMSGRSGDKNKEKTRFTTFILSDRSYEDAYWQESFTKTHSKLARREGRWQMREKVDKDHGGSAAVQRAIDAGLYMSKVTRVEKDGKIIEVEQVRVREDVDREDMLEEHSKKLRAGKTVGTSEAIATFNEEEEADKEDTEDDEDEDEGKIVWKKPAGANPPQDDEYVDNEEDEEDENGEAGGVLKRPAGILKRPAAEDGAALLTEQNVLAIEDNTEKENANLNSCMGVSMKMLNEFMLKIVEMQARLAGVELVGRDKKISEVYKNDIKDIESNAKTTIEQLRHLSVNGRAEVFTDQKVQVLNDAAALINDIKDITKSVKSLTKHFGELPLDVSTQG